MTTSTTESKSLTITLTGHTYRVREDRWTDAAGEAADIVVERLDPDGFTPGASRAVELGRVSLLSR